MLKLILLIALTISLGECYQWRAWTAGNYNIPSGAFVGGNYNGRKYYVIRAWYRDGLLPGKYSPDERYAYVSYGGSEVYVQNMEVLIATNDEMLWENANTQKRLVEGGRSSTGDTLFICRFSVGSALVPGKLHNSKCYVPHGGKEHASGNWDTLKFRYL